MSKTKKKAAKKTAKPRAKKLSGFSKEITEAGVIPPDWVQDTGQDWERGKAVKCAKNEIE